MLPKVWFSVKSAARMLARCCPYGGEQFRGACRFDNRFQRIESWLAGAVLRGRVVQCTNHAPAFLFVFMSGKIDPRIILIGTWRDLAKWFCHRVPRFLHGILSYTFTDGSCSLLVAASNSGFVNDHNVGIRGLPAAARPLPCRTHSYGLDCGYEYAVDICQHRNCHPTFRSSARLCDTERIKTIEHHRRSLFGDSDVRTHPDTRRRHPYHATRPEDGNLPRFGRANAD